MYCFLCPLLFKPRNYIWVLLVTGDKQHLFCILMQSNSQVPVCQTSLAWAGNLPDFNPLHLLFVWRQLKALALSKLQSLILFATLEYRITRQRVIFIVNWSMLKWSVWMPQEGPRIPSTFNMSSGNEDTYLLGKNVKWPWLHWQKSTISLIIRPTHMYSFLKKHGTLLTLLVVFKSFSPKTSLRTSAVA